MDAESMHYRAVSRCWAKRVELFWYGGDFLDGEETTEGIYVTSLPHARRRFAGVCIKLDFRITNPRPTNCIPTEGYGTLTNMVMSQCHGHSGIYYTSKIFPNKQ